MLARECLAEFKLDCELRSVRPKTVKGYLPSTPKAYGRFSLWENIVSSKLGSTHEINIGVGALSRSIEKADYLTLRDSFIDKRYRL